SRPGTATPAPAAARSGAGRGPVLPSRASFQLPPVAAPVDTRADLAETPGPATAKPGTAVNEPLAWADEEDGRRGIGPTALVAAAVAIMVAVYVGATLLMK
ncbi:MAG: hypothetical protein K2X87_08785, partial [Gemmataceae bacterium]|nr:hypothetical protein [Gemmataceae bacterium]